MPMRINLARLLAILGGALNVIATAAIFVMPMYEGVRVTVTSNGERIEEHFRQSLLEAQSHEPITISFFGTIILVSLVAVFLAIRATNVTHRRIGIALLAVGALLLIASFISGFSVGLFYLPGAVFVLAAGVLITAYEGPGRF
jgi:hypothetical protein